MYAAMQAQMKLNPQMPTETNRGGPRLWVF